MEGSKSKQKNRVRWSSFVEALCSSRNYRHLIYIMNPRELLQGQSEFSRSISCVLYGEGSSSKSLASGDESDVRACVLYGERASSKSLMSGDERNSPAYVFAMSKS